MNRLYAIESTPTLTGAKADHRLAVGGVGGREASRASSRRPSARRRRRRRRACRGRVHPMSPGGWPRSPRISRPTRDGRWWSPAIPDRRPCTPPPRRSTTRSATPARRSLYGTSIEAAPAGRRDSNRGARAGHGRRTGRAARDHGRQSGVHRARGPALRRAARQGAARRLSLDAPRRDVAALPLARPRDTSARKLGRRAIVRRHRHADAAADRAALRGTVCARFPRRVHDRSPGVAASPSSRTTGPRPTAAAPAAGRSRIRAARASRTPTRSGARRCTTDSWPARA